MNFLKSLMGRRQFMISAGLASASALAVKKIVRLAGHIFKTDIAGAIESNAGDIKKLGGQKCVIIYFSLTGNTEKVARVIYKGVVGAGCSCDIVPMKEANPAKLEGYDIIGFGNPIMGQLRWNVYNFLKAVRYVGGRHLFLFSTAHSGGNNFNQHEAVPFG